MSFEITKEMRTFEAIMQLRDLKVGTVLTEKQLLAIEFFIGDLLVQARSMKPKVFEIHFDKLVEFHA